MSGWYKTMDGADVFTEDGEWFWSHQAQGWFHAPGLVTAVPAPPLATRVQDEVHRLRTGWPSFWKIFDLRGQRGEYLIGTLVLYAAMLWMWVYKIGLDWGIHHVARSWQQEVYKFYAEATLPPYANTHGAWYYGDSNPDHSRNIMMVILFLVITAAILYTLYVGVAWQADPHKGALLVGAVVATTVWHQHQRNERQHDQQLARDVANELHRRHSGGLGDGYR